MDFVSRESLKETARSVISTEVVPC